MLLNEVRKLNWFMCMNNGIDAKDCNHANPGINWPKRFENSAYFKGLNSEFS